MGRSKFVDANFTRPNDTNAYTAGDAVSNATSSAAVVTFAGCAPYQGGGGVILSALLIDSANKATKGQFELWLFDTAPTAQSDNAAFAPTDAENRTLVAVLEFDDQVFVGDATSNTGNCVFKATNKESFPFMCAAGSKDLYGLVVVRNAYTPIAQERFDVRLMILQDD